MEPLDILGGIWDFGSKLFQTGYNLYTNQRDFDYQKELQKQIFEREDTAVQRRMEDLKAAGLNPNLAAGSSAGAGAVVGRSTTNDIGVGSALDTIQAINQIRLQRQEKENASIQNDILKHEEYIKDNDKMISMANTLAMLGIPFSVNINNRRDGTFGMYVGLSPDDFKKGYKYNVPGSLSYLQKAFDLELQNAQNSAAILQKDNDFYTADKITGYLSSLLPNVGFSFGKKFR